MKLRVLKSLDQKFNRLFPKIFLSVLSGTSVDRELLLVEILWLGPTSGEVCILRSAPPPFR